MEETENLVEFRRGKMFKTRCISAVFLVLIALFTLIMGGWILAVTLLLISLIAYHELSVACGFHTDKTVNALEMVGYIAITALYVLLYFNVKSIYVALWFVLFFLCILFVYVFTFPKYHAGQVMASFFCVCYAPLMFAFVYLTRNTPYGVYMVFMVFISAWISDTFAYLTGMLLGKHKLAPVLSPKKSIEGSIGGILGAAIVGALYGLYLSKQVILNTDIIWIAAVIGAVGSVISQLGDLAASAIKRNQEIKDYGKLIPGHGGIMDRFDSVIVTAPMIYFLTILLIG